MDYRLEFDGRISHAFAPQEDIITKLYWSKGQYYECKRGQLLRHFRGLEIDCYVDIGAHWGNHAMFMKDHSKEMFLFEPNPLNYSTLCVNTPKANHFNCAIGSERKLIGMKQEADNNTGSSYVVGDGLIAMVTLDSMSLKPSLLKIDVEGYELEVLKGATETIAKHKPIIAIEAEHNEIEINNILKSLGYNVAIETTNVSKTLIYYP